MDQMLVGTYQMTVPKTTSEKEDGPLFRFYETIMDFGGEFMQKVNAMKDVTLFAPSNEAWNDPNLKNIIRNKEKMKEILNLHIVRDRLNTERMRQTTPNVARAVLERHLVIADKVFTMAELRSMGPDYIVLPTARDSLQVKVKEEEKHTTSDPDRAVLTKIVTITMPVNDNTDRQDVEGESQNLLAKHYKDPRFNAYEEGPGQFLASESKIFGIFLKNIPKSLTETGIINLCNKYGNVAEVKTLIFDERRQNAAKVWFTSIADAQNAMSQINQLRQKKDGKMIGILAECLKVYRKEYSNQISNSSDFIPYVALGDIPNDFEHPLTVPVSIDALKPKRNRSEILKDFDYEEVSSPLETFETITNGCKNYRHSLKTQMDKWTPTSVGSFDEEKQEFTFNDQLALSVTGDCKNCGNCTIKFCKGCNDYFCSLYCLKEYNRDKSGCNCVSSEKPARRSPNRNAIGRGAKLIHSSRAMSPTLSTYSHSISSSVSDVGNVEPCELPSNNEPVVIVRVVSHKIVFVRPVREMYEKYLNDVAAWGKIAPPLDDLPKAGDIVTAQFEGSFYRALVERIENDEAVVAFLELGNLDKKPIKGLKKLRSDLQHVKRFIFKASLSDVDDGLKNEKCLGYLYNLLDRGTELKFILKSSTSDVVQCELLHNESVNGKLSRLNNIKPGNLVTYEQIPVKSLDAGETQVIVIDNTFVPTHGAVTVVAHQHSSQMFFMHQMIQEYAKDAYESPYTPLQKEICLAKCNGQWYRAILEKSFGDMNPVLMFIDFGCYNKCHVNDMRPMPVEFTFPLYSKIAKIADINDKTDMEKLNDRLPLLSLHTVTVKMEKPDEPIIRFNLSGMTDT